MPYPHWFQTVHLAFEPKQYDIPDVWPTEEQMQNYFPLNRQGRTLPGVPIPVEHLGSEPIIPKPVISQPGMASDGGLGKILEPEEIKEYWGTDPKPVGSHPVEPPQGPIGFMGDIKPTEEEE